MLKTIVALAGNRTPVSHVASVNSTTEPPMLITSTIFPAQSHIKYCIHIKRNVALAGNRTPVSRMAGENSTTEPPLLVTSPIFPAQSHMKYCIHVKNKSCIGRESNPSLPRGRREFYHWTTNACNVVNFPCTITYKILHSCKKQRLHWRGIEPRSPAWQARILPLNHQCL